MTDRRTNVRTYERTNNAVSRVAFAPENCTFSEHFHQIFNLKRKILLFIKFLMFWGFQNCPWCDFIMSGSHLIWFLSFVSLLNHVNWNILDFDIWLSGDFVGHCIDFWSKFLLGTKIAHVWEENELLVISIWEDSDPITGCCKITHSMENPVCIIIFTGEVVLRFKLW